MDTSFSSVSMVTFSATSEAAFFIEWKAKGGGGLCVASVISKRSLVEGSIREHKAEMEGVQYQPVVDIVRAQSPHPIQIRRHETMVSTRAIFPYFLLECGKLSFLLRLDGFDFLLSLRLCVLESLDSVFIMGGRKVGEGKEGRQAKDRGGADTSDGRWDMVVAIVVGAGDTVVVVVWSGQVRKRAPK